MNKNYGYELILDLYECSIEHFNRNGLMDYFEDLCDLIKVERGDLYFWDDVGIPREDRQTKPHTIGTSAIQFILTSTITVHTLDVLKECYVNIFSCELFDSEVAREFTEKYFKANKYKVRFIKRGELTCLSDHIK